jgi:hypothetical protein
VTLDQIGAVLKDYGLPIAMLVALFVAMVVRRGNRVGPEGKQMPGSPYLVPGAQVDDLKDELAFVRVARDKREFDIRTESQTQLAYVETLRVEEKHRAELAESRLDAALERLDKIADLAQRQLEETIRGGKK